MQLEFLYLPVEDLPSALSFYRDTLGLPELWREGEGTVGLQLPREGLALMLDVDKGAADRGAGPLFTVPSVSEFYEEHKGSVEFFLAPTETQPGLYAGFTDPAGNPVWVIDNTKEAVV